MNEGVQARPGRRAVLDISLFICATDFLYGMVAPTFSLFVAGLGGSAVLVGVLAGTVGVTRLLGSFPVGSLSDRWGRKTVLVGGAALFCVSCALFTLPSQPLLLIVPRIVFGVAILATFPLGVAYIADVVSPGRQTLAISIYVSAQGLGYTLGPLLGAWLADAYGYDTAYRAAAAIALATAVAAWLRLRGGRGKGPAAPATLLPPRELLRGPILAASVSNVFVMLMFSGAVLPFLSLYAAHVGLSTFGVGVLYATRAAASMLARVPAGLVAGRLSNAHLVVGALVLDAAAAAGIGASGSPGPLFAAAVADGIAFGIFLTSGQSIIAEKAPAERRGAAIGAFAMAGALGETVGAFSFGVVAHVVALRAVFLVAGALLLVCVPVAWRLLRGVDRRRACDRPSAREREEPPRLRGFSRWS